MILQEFPSNSGAQHSRARHRPLPHRPLASHCRMSTSRSCSFRLRSTSCSSRCLHSAARRGRPAQPAAVWRSPHPLGSEGAPRPLLGTCTSAGGPRAAGPTPTRKPSSTAGRPAGARCSLCWGDHAPLLLLLPLRQALQVSLHLLANGPKHLSHQHQRLGQRLLAADLLATCRRGLRGAGGRGRSGALASLYPQVDVAVHRVLAAVPRKLHSRAARAQKREGPGRRLGTLRAAARARRSAAGGSQLLQSSVHCCAP